MKRLRFVVVVVGTMVLLAGNGGAQQSDAVKCVRGKLKASAKYELCRLFEIRKSISLTLATPNFLKCEEVLGRKWARIEGRYQLGCPQLDDLEPVKEVSDQCSDRISNEVGSGITGPRFVTNDDGLTVTDRLTGLMWERKTDDGTIHDFDNTYLWSTEQPGDPRPFDADGSLFGSFLAQLNYCPFNGVSQTSGFAGYCDWRIPTVAELQTIVDPTAPGCGTGEAPCIDVSIFGPTKSGNPPDYYFSASTSESTVDDIWTVTFRNGRQTTPRRCANASIPSLCERSVEDFDPKGRIEEGFAPKLGGGKSAEVRAKTIGASSAKLPVSPSATASLTRTASLLR